MRRTALPLAVLAAAAALLGAACGGNAGTPAADEASPGASTAGGEGSAAGGSSTAGRVDPRRDGLEVALGEWELALESEAIRPGPVTFVVTNRGTMPHGFEIERENENSDAGKVETRVLDPGESVRVELDLRPGVYKLECNVEGHDDLGMEVLLEVRKGARLAPAAEGRTAADPARPAVEIRGFAFEPERVEAAAGQEVLWTNHDSAEHTVTQVGGGFDSGSLAAGATFTARFDRPGSYRYVCALHPAMRGVVVVR